MKILHINEHYGNVGGAERYLSEICSAQGKRGDDPVVVASSEGAIHNAAPPPRMYALTPSFGLRSARRTAGSLKRILRTERPDIVHLHNIQYFIGPPLVRMLQSQTPVIQTVHDTRVICPRWFSKIIPSRTSPCQYPMGSHCFRHGCYPFDAMPASASGNLQKFLLVGWELALLRRLDRVLVPSTYMHQQLRINGFSAQRLEKMPLFLSAEFPPPDKRAGPPRVVFAGRIDETKGVRQFLDCLSQLSTTAWTAQVAGSGPFLAEAKAIAEQQGLTARVEFLGQLPMGDLVRVLAAARVVVMPSMTPESFGLTGLEAQACGTPVVAFDSGGITEWLNDGVTGFVVRWGDVDALASRVRQLLEDSLLAEQLGSQSQQHARQFDRERHVNRLSEIYAEVVTTWRRPVARQRT